MFGNKYKKRLVGDEWIVDAIDMVLNNYCKDEEISDYEINGVTQTSKNKLYVSDYDEFNEQKITENFITLAGYIDKMIDDNWEELNEKVILRKSSVMNLFWMINNGIDTYDQAVEALHLHEEAYTDKDLRNDADESYKWACGGTGAKNMEFRMQVLPEIVEKTKSKVVV